MPNITWAYRHSHGEGYYPADPGVTREQACAEAVRELELEVGHQFELGVPKTIPFPTIDGDWVCEQLAAGIEDAGLDPDGWPYLDKIQTCRLEANLRGCIQHFLEQEGVKFGFFTVEKSELVTVTEEMIR